MCCLVVLDISDIHFGTKNKNQYTFKYFSVPGSSGSRYNRRHSYTPKSPPPNVSAAGITKEMSKLSIANHNGPSTGRGLSPRPSTKRRASTVRRSSRSGQ